MNISEVSKLIPLYVAGSLSEQERRDVAEALSGSEELRKELEFWKQARHAARLYDPTHPLAEAIVNYAEGRVTGQERVALEAHLQQCSDCRHELEIILETYPAAEPVTDERRSASDVSVPDLFREFFKTIRAGYLIPALVLVGLCMFVLVTQLLQENEQPPVVVTIDKSEQRLIVLMLDYTTQLRSTGEREWPRLTVPDTIDGVSLTMRIPRSIKTARYTVELLSPSGFTTRTEDSIRASRYDESLDQITTIIKRSLFNSTGKYRVRVIELLPSGLGLTPETYIYPFLVADSTSAR